MRFSDALWHSPSAYGRRSGRLFSGPNKFAVHRLGERLPQDSASKRVFDLVTLA
jgi:hypothetical protein